MPTGIYIPDFINLVYFFPFGSKNFGVVCVLKFGVLLFLLVVIFCVWYISRIWYNSELELNFHAELN